MNGNDYRDPANASFQNQLGMQQAGGGIGGLGYLQQVTPQPVRELVPRDAAGLIAVAEKRIVEIDKQLAGVAELQAERERLLRIVGTKEAP